MDFMGLGPLEILLVLILGFIFLGPENLPGMAAKAGEWYRKFQKATFDLSKSVSEEIAKETKPIKEESKQLIEEKRQLTDETKQLMEDTKPPQVEKGDNIT
jgi:sec-independent protein translocase protein TatB